MHRRLLCGLIVIGMLFSCSSAEDLDSPGGGGRTERFDQVSGYADRLRLRYDGEFGYLVTEDGKGAAVAAYRGKGGNVRVPSVLGGYPVVSVDGQAFWHHETLETVELPEGVQTIGIMAFYMCSGLENIILPEGVRTIEQGAFGGCRSLMRIDLPESLENVEDFAFLACSGLKEIRFGEELKSIGAGAFRMCSSLEKVYLPGQQVKIGTDAFAECAENFSMIH